MTEPFSHKLIMSVLAFVLAAGGYGGYEVVKKYGKYGTNFEIRPHRVVEVLDGDTVIIEDNIRVRLLGIDAPESSECYGPESKEQLSKLVLGQEIILEKDQTATDQYGRLLRYATIYNENPESENILLNVELARSGNVKASYIKPNRRYLSQIQAAQMEAEKEKLGLWGKCNYEKVEDPNREQSSDTFDKECVIKASISKQYEKTYFLPGCPNYKRVKVDPRKGEKWFCSEAEAEQDGWIKAPVCNNLIQ